MRPLLFVGDNYAYWKRMMRLFIQANDYEAQKVIVNGRNIHKKKVREEKVIKEETEWDANDLKMAQLNAKAMHTLFFALGEMSIQECFYVKMQKKCWTSSK